MHIYTLVLTTLKGHELLPGMVYSIYPQYAEWDTLLSLLFNMPHSCSNVTKAVNLQELYYKSRPVEDIQV